MQAAAGSGRVDPSGRLGSDAVGPDIDLAPLYGALSPAEQDRAIAPATPGRRKVVLATSIAETSLTIEGVRIVVDSGLSRLPDYEPGIGLTRLVTARASRASVALTCASSKASLASTIARERS